MKFSRRYFFCFSLMLLFLSFINSHAEDKNYEIPPDHKSGIRSHADMLASGMVIASDGRVEMQTQYESASGHFLIHYDTSGVNSVDLTDANNNNTPDYIDSVAFYFDYAYLVEIDTMGFLPPISDKGLGGSDALDVYIIDFAASETPAYGYTSFDQYPIDDPHIFQRFTSSVFIDNNYSSLDSIEVSDEMHPLYRETGIQGMKITAAHEFHHTVQLAYGVQQPASVMLNEMVSTWMEYRVHPDSKDYLQFVDDLFFHSDQYAFAYGVARVGYRYAIFGQFMHKRFGDRVFLRMFELIGEDIDGYSALDSAMREQGSNLTAAWRDFIPWLYYTGDRAIPGEFFVQAAEFPTLPNYLNSEPITFDGDFSTSKGGTLKLFEFRMYSFILASKSKNTDDTLSIVLVNPDMQSTVIQNRHARNLFSILCSERNGTNKMKTVPGTEYFYSVGAEKAIIDSIYINSGYCTSGVSYAYPNPYMPGIGDLLSFPLPDNALINDKAHLSIMRSDMISIYSAMLPVMSDNLRRVVRWEDIPDDLSSGIYIFKVTYKDDIKLGKFAVIR